jgi:hypothetical protein
MKLTVKVCVAATALAAVSAGGYAVAQQLKKSPAPAAAKVYFIQPQDGATVKRPVHVVMGLSGMGIAPAGVDAAETGHHHILVDVDKPNTEAMLPMDDKHRHFGRGQTETMLDIPAGRHTLQLVLGDRNHVPHDPPVMSQKITITVTD